uniref:Uncharacterized protein n=1 Tax=Ditylenchus dipsaci TaxID=166011 RepID=A0A915DBL4_9BILA
MLEKEHGLPEKTPDWLRKKLDWQKKKLDWQKKKLDWQKKKLDWQKKSAGKQLICWLRLSMHSQKNSGV